MAIGMSGTHGVYSYPGTDYDCPGTVLFVGRHNALGTIHVGVEFDNAVGTMNGTVEGHAYFQCDEKFGSEL